MIEIRALKKSYGPIVAVDELTLEIPAGCVFGFLGRNGAGKTTTIRMMMGLLEPTAGTVLLGGHDIRRAPEAAKAITGYLPDHPYLYDKLTAEEFLRFVSGLYGIAARDGESRARSLLGDFALAERADELVETFSHGMKQRLALAGALIHRPRILVLDEPMVGLDPQGALDFRRLLAQLAASGVTIFLSTHSLAVAEELCTRIGVLDRGRLVALGSLAELRARAGMSARTNGDGALANGGAHGAHGGPSLEQVFLDLVGAADGQW
ncbi:MAG TPA: ABC transporter ATP-binding protein [Candidatus Binatia bacterium]|nr:ABC transporter ATP-binding protein [Candidatus Binatia bacterium]